MAAPAEPAATNERERESDDAKAIDSPSPSDTPSPIDSPKDKDSSPKEDSEEMVGKEKSVSDGAESSDAADEKRRARREDENVVADLSDPASATTATVDCPPSFVGRVIGKGGETIKGLQAQSGAHITIDQNFPEGVPRKISISGPSGCVTIAVRLIEELLTGNGGRAFGGGGVGPGQARREVRCPKEMVGRVIGRGGETVKGLQATTGARIQIDQTSTPCVVTITGNPRCVEAAARAVADVVRGGSTAAYSAVNVNRREAMANYSMYARSAGRHAQGPYGAGLGVYGPGGPPYGGVAGAQSMAQLEHQFGLMGYGNPNRGGHVNMGPGGQTNYPYGVAPAFARGGSAYGYPPSDAYGYGGDPGSFAYAHGAEYAMQMAQMQAHMMGTTKGPGSGPGPGNAGPGAAGGVGGGGVPPHEGAPPMGQGGPNPNPGAGWMSHEQMAQMAQFQQDMMQAQAQHMGAFAPESSPRAPGGRGSSFLGGASSASEELPFPGGTASFGTETQTGQTTAGALSAGSQGSGQAGPSPPTGPMPPMPRPRPTEGDTAWNPPRPL